MRRLTLLVVVGLLAAACGDSTATTSTAAPEAPTATTQPPATTEPPATTLPPPTTQAPATTEAFAETSDMVYMTMNGVELLMDVYTPAGDGPWPVVVAFHGLDSHGKDAENTIPVAEAAAAEGMVVFTPSWIVWDPSPFPFTIEVFEGWKAAASCAVAFAQQSAADHGGDPAKTVVYGFSGGAGAALLASLEPGRPSIQGCETEAQPAAVVGVVLGDGPYFLHDENFDEAFEVDLEAMQAEVASLIDTTTWPPDLDAEFFLWIPENGTGARTIDDPSDDFGWFALRDPDGSIRTDLDRLNQLEDGIISNSDAAQLLELRLATAGFEVTLDEYPGGHTTQDKVPELVGYLKAAATD